MPQIHKKVNYNGREIHYRDEGSRNTKTVILLHGLLQDLTVWGDFTLKLMREFRVISIDLPGHGFSSMFNNECHTMEFIAQCINEVIIAAGVKDCVIIGHSWGGYAALAYAKKYEYNVKGIGLLHAHAFSDGEEKQASRQRVCDEVKQNRPNYILQFIPSLFSQNNQAPLAHKITEIKEAALAVTTEAIIAAQNGMMRRQSMIEFLAKTDKPVMMIYGKNDTRIPIEFASAMATIPRQSETLMLENVSHMAHVESPKQTLRWIANFINGCYNDCPFYE